MSSVKEIIETFLITYRTTPNDSLPDSKSPAEILLGRKPRTTLDLLKPPPIQPIERDQAMEKKFNRRFGTRPQIFASKDAVWARHRLSQSWKAGTICGCSGVIYNVLENRPDPVNDEDEVEEAPIREEQQDVDQAVRSPTPQRRYRDRRRQPPVRFSPR
ncbi:hypothetical protein niasHT_036717 [Heterodera trifolii]|uniref:Uncharacterized protein n=1 Tax=Heterodera trifolii TaxID=157864 RepID=A0ABD2J618_9BILA